MTEDRNALTGVPEGAGPPPSKLHSQAHAEHPTDREAARARYIELMRQHGYIVDADHPDAGPPGLPCGWTPDA